MIRIAEETDFDAILTLLRQLNPDDPVINDGRDREIFKQILKNPNLYLFLVDESHSVLATCYLNIIPNLTRNASPYGIIENVVTNAEYRNKGYGQQVVKAALEYAWKQGCYKVMLQTGSKRESTHHFYRSCGFVARKTAYNASNPKYTKQ